MKFWNSGKCRSAFDKIKGHPIIPPRAADRDLTDDSHASDILTSYFQRDVLEVVQSVCNKLMQTKTMQGAELPDGVFLGKPAEEDLGNDECEWKPSFVVKAQMDGGDEETRLLGQVEYLGGRGGALTWAVRECARNSWGSLRCVLGKSSSAPIIMLLLFGSERVCVRY